MLRRRALYIRGLLSAIVLAFALQLSGTGHAIADALACESHEAHEDEDCSDGGRECPPGCPDCHCSHMGAGSIAPAFAEPVQFATRVVFSERRQAQPPQPASDQLFRPPRA